MGLRIKRVSLLKYKVITAVMTMALVLQPMYTIAASVTAYAASVLETSVADLATTVASAAPGDTINITTGGTITSKVVINKPLTLTSSNGSVIDVAATNGLNAIGIQSDNVTIENLKFESSWNFGDGSVIRALEVSSHDNITIRNNSFNNLRQPAYINDNTTGVIQNNYTNITKGWVVLSNTNLNFVGNTWGDNVLDIAILAAATNNYNDSDVVAMSDTNNNAVVENQFGPTKRLSDAYVAPVANGRSGDEASKWNPTTSIQTAVGRVVDGGTVVVGAGTYGGNVTVDRPLTLAGANKGIAGTSVRTTESVVNGMITVSANDVTINGFTINGPTGSSAVAMQGNNSNETISNNIINNNGYAINFRTGNTMVNRNKIVHGSSAFSGVEANSNPGDNLTFDSNSFSGGINVSADITVLGNTSPRTSNVNVTNNTSTSGTSLAALFSTINATVAGNNYTGNGSSSAIYVGGGNSNVSVTDNTFASAATALRVADSFGWGSNETISAHNNRFETSNTNAVNVSAGAYSGTSVDAKNNWWGSANGPNDTTAGDGSTLDTNNGSGSKAVGAVTYTAWCLTNTCATYSDTTLAAPINLTPADGTITNNKNFGNSWKAVENAIGYEYQTSYSSNGTTLGSIIYSDSSITNPSRYDLSGSTVYRTNINTPDATYYWQVRTVNAEGITGPWSVIQKVTVDTVAPSSTHNLGAVVGGTVSITQTVSDNVEVKSGKLRIWKINADGSLDNSKFYAIGDVSVDSDNKVVYTLNTPTNLYGDGKYMAKFTSTDKAGNASVAQKEFTLDNTKPVITIKTGSGVNDGTVGTNNSYSRISFKLNDPNGGLAKVVLNGHEYARSNEWNDLNWSNITKSHLIEGVNTIYAVDRAGNQSAVISFGYDKTAPGISWQVQPASFVSNQFHVRPITTEVGTVKSVYIDTVSSATLCRTLTSDHKNFDTQNSHCQALLDSLSEGTHKFIAVFTDYAGNTTTSESNSFVIDRTAPEVAVKSGYIGSLSDKTFSQVSFKLHDTNEIDKYVLNDSTVDLTNNSWSDANFQNIKSKLVQGVNTLTLYDAAGNSTDYTFVYDTVAPLVPVHEFPANGAVINVNDFWFNWTDVADAVSYEMQNSQNPAVGSNGSFVNVQWSGDYQQIQPTESKARSVGANGTWYWQIRAVDAAGNKSAWTTPWSVTIDQIAPGAPTLLSPANGVVMKGASVTQSWNAPATDVDYYVYESYNDEAMTSLRFTDTFTSTSKTALNVTDATYWWRVKAVDIAGNAGSWSSLWKIVIDNTAPVVAMGEDYQIVDNIIIPSVSADDVNNPLTYSWEPADEASASNVTISDPTSAAPSFTANASGTYSFLLTTTDPAGNATTKTFTFTYTAPSVPVTPLSNTVTNNGGVSGSSQLATTGNFTNVALNDGTNTDSASETAVLGAQTESDDKSKTATILGATATPEQSSDSQWNIAGLAWYWWLIIIAALAGAGWWFAAALRRRSES